MTGKRDFVCQADCCESFARSDWVEKHNQGIAA